MAEKTVDGDQEQDRLAGLEARLGQLEDCLAVVQLVNAWGPAIDCGDSEAAADLWSEDGVIQSDLTTLDGRAAIAAMVGSERMRSSLRQGPATVQSFPLVSVKGDVATATGYSRIYRHTDGGGHKVSRIAANHWEFRRTERGWRITRRTNHAIDGGPEARDLVRRDLGPA